MTRCDMEENVSEEPLHIDEPEETILCRWCPTWKGSIKTKVVNQHVRKAASHTNARKKIIGIEEQGPTGVYKDIRTFFKTSNDAAY